MGVSHRGVWKVSWGPGKPSIVVVIGANDALVTEPVVVPPTVDCADLSAEFWRVLNAADPNPPVSAGTPPTFRRVSRPRFGQQRDLTLVRGDG